MKFEMGNEKCVMRKTGVSLITVLLFMLIATIAATATYKWITSEGHSSASRMIEREAYQSAVAGIESARSWMTYHANETGALIEQYKKKANNNAPVKLTEQLAEFVQAGQSFDVWLVGVNTGSTPGSPYKLKIMSTGRARNGEASHSEIAIFNVSGLYQMQIQQQHVSIASDFKYAYFGGTTNFQGGSMPSSMVVNGDWSGNPVETTNGDFVVTGDATLSGDNISVSEYACFGGDLNTKNGFLSKYLYVAGKTKKFTGIISHDAYFDGDMEMSSACGDLNFHVEGNMTVGGKAKVKFDQCQNKRTVDGNTCIIEDENGNNGQILADGNNVYLKGGAWISSNNPFARTDGSDNATNIVIGTDNDDHVYIKYGHPYSDYGGSEGSEGLTNKSYNEKGKRNCPTNKRFKIRDENYDTSGDDYNWQGTPYVFSPPTSTNNVVNVCGSLVSHTADSRKWHTGSGWTYKDGTDYFVDYVKGWTNWTETSARGIFPEMTSMDGYYYIYNAPNDFLKFDDNNQLDDWRVFKDVGGLTVDDPAPTAGNNPIPIYIPSNTKYSFDKYFHNNKAIIGSYTFEGTPRYRYYEPTTGANNFYRYVNNKPTGSPYCNKGSGTLSTYRPTCHVTPWFTVNGKFENWESTKPSGLVCAEGTKEHCYSIWTETPNAGCTKKDGTKANFKVNDQIKIGYDVFKNYANKAPCASKIVNLDHNTIIGFLSKSDGSGYDGDDGLNKCYESAKTHDVGKEESEKYLYNGYLVLEMSNAKLFTSVNNDYALKGKFIFIVNSREGQALKMPRTNGSDDFVFLYLPKGYGEVNFQGTSVSPYNYFIYSEGPITKLMGATSNELKGTVYVTAASCSKVDDMWETKATFNQDLVTNMMMNGVICKYSATSCGGPAAEIALSAGEGDITTTTTYKTDSHYIGVAPQLSVTLESQYENNEKITAIENAEDVKGSFIVLPRVVYLTTDAVGKLKDYYKVVTLNSSEKTDVSGVTCDPPNKLKTSGLLTQDGNIAEDLYTCTVTGSIKGVQSTVDFYVKVAGEGAAKPKVSFKEDAAEVGIGGSKEVKLNWEKMDAGVQCKVSVAVSDHNESEWSVTPKGATGSGPYVFTINTSNDPNNPSQNPAIFDVENVASSDGSLYFMIVDVEGCNPGTPSTEVLYNSNNMTVKRKGLAEYCGASGPGYGSDECKSGGEYYEKKSWPSCFADGDEDIWVMANGQNCKANPSAPNDEWSCGITSNITLTKVNENIPGCVTIFPPNGISTNDAPFADGAIKTLYADAKAVQQTFHVGFVVEGTLSGEQKINISVVGPGDYEASKTCTYAKFNSSERADFCDIGVYRNSAVTLTLSPEGSKENGFNYWKCESGTDCSANETSAVPSYFLTIKGENTVYAHFGETDKHCFFDEFKKADHSNKTSIECSDTDPYCIDDCESVDACGSANAGQANVKWKLVEGSMSNLNYSSVDGTIALDGAATRGMKESEKAAVKAVVLSTASPGKHGELKAQFQVPFEKVSSGDVGTATVKNSGFILHSDPANTSFLLLNIYAESSGALKARLCLKKDGEADKCQTKSLGVDVSSTSIIMASAERLSEGGVEKLKVSVWPSSWSSSAYSATFTLTDSEISGIEAALAYEYVGFSLANPNFKIHGIGWRSETYGSECWDTYPTLSCSFKAAFAGGIVPLKKDDDESTQNLRPWTGLSAWYGTRTCAVDFYYIGTDACSGNESEYTKCNSGTSGGYSFTTGGAHGYSEGDVDKKTARAVVENCTVYGDEAAWATNDVAAHCGAFWVGDFKECTRNYTFVFTTNNAEGDYYKLDPAAKANLRDAKVKVSLDNPNASEVEIYLFSKNETSGFYDGNNVYSLPYKTNATSGTVEITVADISNVDGFDPEKVEGIFVKTFNDISVTINSVQSSCDHVIAITGCSASYDGSAQKWKINTDIKNYTQTASIAVEEVNSKITDGAPSCNNSTTPCGFSSISGPQATNTLEWGHNPYANAGGDTYRFKVTLTSEDGETKDCTTSEVNQTGITATCDGLSRTTVPPGGNLPVLTYGISNCPDSHCKYKVTLSNNTEIVAATETGSGSWTTSANAANVSGSALPEGDYHFVVSDVSTAPVRAFTDCISPTFKVQKSTVGLVQGTCLFNPPTVYPGNITTLNITNVGESSKWDERGNNQISGILSGGGGSQSVTIDRYNQGDVNHYSVTAPAAAAEPYTYSITYDDNTFCTASLTVIQLTDVLSATCSDIYTYPLASTPWNIALTGNGSLTKTVSLVASVNGKTSITDCNSSYCAAPGNINAPAGVADYTYSLTADGTQLCTNNSRKYIVQNPLVCKVNGTTITNGQTINMDEGESFKFKAEWAYAYGNGTYTNCTIEGNNANKTNDCYNSPSIFNSEVTITPSGAGEKPYSYSTELSYNGSAGPFTCNWKMNVKKKKPTFKCKSGLKATVGESDNVVIGLTDVTGCDEGGDYCYYRISGHGSTATEQSGYTGGDFPVALTVPETTKGNEGDTALYVVTLRNSGGESDSKVCSVEFTKSSGGAGCSCTDYCTQAQCDDLRISGDLQFDGNCYFATSISVMNGDKYTINGKDLDGWKNSGFPVAVDGGYYITSTGSNYGSTVTLGEPSPGCRSYHTCVKKTCIAWVNGTGGYSQNCYSSGLNGHPAGKCYTLNTANVSDTNYPDNNATNTWWWKEVDCNDFCI